MKRLSVVVLVAVMMGASLSCVQNCTLELRTAIAGDLVDANGGAITPDRVITTVDGVDELCAVEGNRFYCYERGGGDYSLHIEAGAFVYDVTLELEDDGCHVTETLEHDVVVP